MVVIPAPLCCTLAPVLLSLSLLTARSFGLVCAGGMVIGAASFLHHHKGTLTPRQEDCLGVGISLSLMFVLFGEYMYHLQGQRGGGAVVLDVAITLLLFVVVILFLKAMFSDPGLVNGKDKSPFDVLDGIFEEKKFGAPVSSPAAALPSPAWQSRKRCESCFAQRRPRIKHCNACEACIHRFDHHCHYIGNCVGANNHRLFMALIVSAMAAVSLWVAAAGRVLHYATPMEWDDIIYGEKRDLLASLILACMCLTWMLILFLLQVILIGWDTTSFEIYHTRRGSSGGFTIRDATTTTTTTSQFTSNLVNFFLRPSPSNNHRDHQPLNEPIERKGSSFDDRKWCNAV